MQITQGQLATVDFENQNPAFLIHKHETWTFKKFKALLFISLKLLITKGVSVWTKGFSWI
jgi:hypothetical protein